MKWLTLLFGTLTVLMLSLWLKELRTRQTIEANVRDLQDSTEHYKDRFGTEHARAEELQGNVTVLRVTNAAELDTAKKRDNLKDREVVALQHALMIEQGHFKSQVVEVHDTIHIPGQPVVIEGGTMFSFADSTISEVCETEGDTVSCRYTLAVPVYLAEYWKRPGLLKPKCYYVDGYSTVPDVKIKGLDGVRVAKNTQKWWVKYAIGFGAGILVHNIVH